MKLIIPVKLEDGTSAKVTVDAEIDTEYTGIIEIDDNYFCTIKED